jgi:hypothetical protein
MFEFNWNAVAADLAGYVKVNLPSISRGSISIPFGTEREVVAVFAHDARPMYHRRRRQMDLVRCALAEVGVDEAGFGVSDDGCCWTLVVSSSEPAARLRLFLEEAVPQAWWIANGILPPEAGPEYLDLRSR